MTRALGAGALASFVVALAACGGNGGTKEPATAAPVQIAPFTYDPSRSLAIRDIGRVNSNRP